LLPTTGASELLAGISLDELHALESGDHSEPHRILGAHPIHERGEQSIVIRAFHPNAVSVECLFDDGTVTPLRRIERANVFAARIVSRSFPLPYRLRFHFRDGSTWERGDPYRFLPSIGDLDLHLFNEGTHHRLWTCLGAHVRSIDGVEGVAFAVWAPNARRVSVVGDFCGWDGRIYPMRQMGGSGVFELFVPEIKPGAVYKYEIKTADGHLRLKTDPFAFAMQVPPETASRIYQSHHCWTDADWTNAQSQRDMRREPISIYEVHLGSWMRVPEDNYRRLTYREIAPKLVEHVKRLGFTHIELLPIAEHPFELSWGYQVTGYYAPTSRFGDPDDFRFFVDTCHQNGIGVILDWVPGHFPRDDFALRRFDGTALYEHDDSRLAEHPDWGTLIFNYGRREVRNFLLANALFWFDEFHIDGLRVDAVASMLYLDYSRKQGEWIPNRYGGNENLEAIEFLREVNATVAAEFPWRMMIAEESTAFGGVTRSVADGGLGFTFKWNMGWMHDTLLYFSKEPVHRKHHQNDLTFAMLYEHTERFIMPISHDEVVHGKGSLINKMPGDLWQQFANLRLLLAYQFTRPGKKLLFMGTELAPYNEWFHEVSLDWHLLDDPYRKGLIGFMESLGKLYHERPCLWQRDPDPEGFAWITCDDHDNSVLAYERRSDRDSLVVVLNCTPVPRNDYRIGAPIATTYRQIFSSDDVQFAGSGFESIPTASCDRIPCHGRDQSLNLQLPPLSAIMLQPEF